MAHQDKDEADLKLTGANIALHASNCGILPASGNPLPPSPAPAPPLRHRRAPDRPLPASAPPEASGGANRCSRCRRRVGLTAFRCRCGDLFCAEHRYSDRHECGFDYKAEAQEAIARGNPVVKAAKLLKI